MLAASFSATLSSKPTGHNCFTFAKVILDDLNDVNKAWKRVLRLRSTGQQVIAASSVFHRSLCWRLVQLLLSSCTSLSIQRNKVKKDNHGFGGNLDKLSCYMESLMIT